MCISSTIRPLQQHESPASSAQIVCISTSIVCSSITVFSRAAPQSPHSSAAAPQSSQSFVENPTVVLCAAGVVCSTSSSVLPGTSTTVVCSTSTIVNCSTSTIVSCSTSITDLCSTAVALASQTCAAAPKTSAAPQSSQSSVAVPQSSPSSAPAQYLSTAAPKAAVICGAPDEEAQVSSPCVVGTTAHSSTHLQHDLSPLAVAPSTTAAPSTSYLFVWCRHATTWVDNGKLRSV